MVSWLNSFPYLTPYEKPFYFILIALFFIPSIIYSLKGKRLTGYQAFLTLFFLWISFAGPNKTQGLALIGYLIWQVVVSKLYFNYRQQANQSGWFYLSVLLSIVPMFLIKLLPIFTQQAPLVNHGQPLFYFLGYSYLTFKSVQVIMETRDGQIKELKIKDYVNFLVFFPTISAGPIDRFRRFTTNYYQHPDHDTYVKLLGKGINYIFLGILYKFIIGYLLGSLLLPVIQNEALNGSMLFLGSLGYMYVYSFYLFFDFAGYSLFAVGVSYLLGYETPMNFNKPFIAQNIKDFWNRWHMSLSFWFRDYVYMRLMFTLIKKKVFKSRIVASNIGYFALFLIMGVWHGLTWYYIAYGLFHATAICVNDAWLRYKKKHKGQLPSNHWTKALAIFITFNTVCFSLLIFSGFFDLVIKQFFTI
ncbi:D-alanyl-lipoteichoic acid biosynthesis protein DltB [Vagococcus xieshaowenii]|uniref:Teichoic acid D-alanyltransferase n=1 Tax=Vagococcus xieshaowenii TaxID=2562451 RepID=A0AAJ5JLG3_9ENTE|nr:D-alanyl-lipoteichoic acid biosynthesis protein DltB [Vagococcus xieshaowenii]QCA29629.1 D-alanyl-lipoteichoic acid biosynthesis protein DltB [Vagococcus xieshaowenii]TFZ42680.1 D-alanyl-lipoteichoic acid biosynthesis protein DltB [Vagococcus xieshaowenii]